MNLQPGDIKIMGRILDDLDDQIREVGPCEHPVNICVCQLQATRDDAADLFYRISFGRAGSPKKPVPMNPELDMVDFARNLLMQTNVERLAQLKAEADARNTAFRKGNIND